MRWFPCNWTWDGANSRSRRDYPAPFQRLAHARGCRRRRLSPRPPTPVNTEISRLTESTQSGDWIPGAPSRTSTGIPASAMKLFLRRSLFLEATHEISHSYQNISSSRRCWLGLNVRQEVPVFFSKGLHKIKYTTSYIGRDKVTPKDSCAYRPTSSASKLKLDTRSGMLRQPFSRFSGTPR